MRDVYLDYVHAEGSQSCSHTDQALFDLLGELRRRGICFQLADESILARHGSNEQGALRIGQRTYQKVILPKMQSIARETLELLEGFEGGLCVMGLPSMIDGVSSQVSLSSNLTLDEIERDATVSFHSDGLCGISARRGEIGDYLFIKNYSRTESSAVSMKGVAEAYSRLDLDTMTVSHLTNEMTVEPMGGLVLIKDEAACEAHSEQTAVDITKDFHVTAITDNFLTVDYASVSYDGVTFGKRMPVPGIFEGLLRDDYRGKVWVKYTFSVKDLLPIRAWIEREPYTSVMLNDRELPLRDCAFDVMLAELNLEDALRIGENELVLALDYYQHEGVHFALFDPLATESLRNCLYYDTYVGSVFLCGDFTVNAEHEICARQGLPALSSRMFEEGYPFFKGELTVAGDYEWNGEGRRILSLEKGRFLVAELVINGQSTHMVMDTKKEITDLLQKGINRVEIKLRSSLRNLFGPHHWHADESQILTTGPRYFTMRSTWRDGESEQYTHEYHFVPFGLDAVEMIEVKN